MDCCKHGVNSLFLLAIFAKPECLVRHIFYVCPLKLYVCRSFNSIICFVGSVVSRFFFCLLVVWWLFLSLFLFNEISIITKRGKSRFKSTFQNFFVSVLNCRYEHMIETEAKKNICLKQF